jgi:hypothetical protein
VLDGRRCAWPHPPESTLHAIVVDRDRDGNAEPATGDGPTCNLGLLERRGCARSKIFLTSTSPHYDVDGTRYDG